jgi:hypothetical protein
MMTMRIPTMVKTSSFVDGFLAHPINFPTHLTKAKPRTLAAVEILERETLDESGLS